ncbi:hypothetical protein G5T42_07490 [Microbacterium sp. 4R-513]|uniref:hypothetical protein n=1 Tax=Microbacterium sp. 4R-513 TaxID=2567934 RepID=UPI0013E100A9|nr:hypothetical protein [Microbacterium sp. 4R-513]QIG39349.1 hypothetical protein G5T42_07490 [Microbacterium sp. 4R-513]
MVFFAMGQLVSNVAFTLWSPNQLQSGVEFSPLIPPGAMFSIWGLIITASILWSVLQLRPAVRESPLRDRLVLPLSVVYAGFGVWLAAASLGQESPLTLVVFVVIVGAHVIAWRRISAHREEIAGWRRLDRMVLHLSEGLYAGWTSMALYLNVATVVQATGAPIEGAWGTTWQLLVVAAAAGTAVLFVVITRGSIWYTATACYALVGATISSTLGGFTALAVALVIGIVAIIGSTIAVRAVDRRRTRRG